MKRSLLSGLILGAFLAIAIQIPTASAQNKDNKSNDLQSSKAIVDSIHNTAAEFDEKRRIVFESLGKSFQESAKNVSKTLYTIKKQQLVKGKEVMPFYYDLRNVISEGVISRFTALQASKKLDQITNETVAGYAKVENISQSSDQNPAADNTALQWDAFLYQKIQDVFCLPDARRATDDCIKMKAKMGLKPSESFVDFFTGERTWSDASVLDAMLIARRLFGANKGKTQFGYDTLDRTKFVDNQSVTTQNNLRMTILNDLASRRAPTSTATKSILGFMLQIMANSSANVLSVDADKACNTEGLTINKDDAPEVKSAKFINGYVCSYTNTPPAGGARIISQAAIDKVMQRDFYMSPNFYSEINSGAYGEAGLDRMEVFMKAQQVAQDYRALRLLQMKTAAVAVSMINSK